MTQARKTSFMFLCGMNSITKPEIEERNTVEVVMFLFLFVSLICFIQYVTVLSMCILTVQILEFYYQKMYI